MSLAKQRMVNTAANVSVSSDSAEAESSALPLVGIIVVHYQKLEDTLRCLESLKELEYSNAFVIVVDSASPNGSGYVLCDRFNGNGIEVIVTPDNQGFAASNNVGIKRARTLGAEYVWLLNADTSVEKAALNELVMSAERYPNAGAWGSKILYGETENSADSSPEKRIWSAGGILDFQKQSVQMRGSDELDRGQWDKESSCDYLPGCSMLISCSALNSFGYMPEEYFMYFEETAWCTRMRKLGFDLRYVPQSVVYHHFDDQKTQSPFNIYYYNRNQLIFWFRSGTLQQKLALFFRTLVFRLPRVVADFFRAENQFQRNIFRAHLLSTLDFLGLRRGKRYRF